MSKILHLSNDYSGSTVYMNLIRELDNLGVVQVIYNPVREQSRVGKNAIDFKTEGSEIIYRPILNYHVDRVFYPWKVRKVLDDIQKHVDVTKIDFIHAHTWYSDGSVAYELSKKYKIPYIVTIRNTDINLFQQKLRYVRPYGRKILDKAQNVTLIAASYKDRVLSQRSLKTIFPNLQQKLKIIPNGVDSFWIKEAKRKVLKRKATYRFLYIGKLSSGKNVLNLVKAIKRINKEGLLCTLELVGANGNDEIEILKQTEKYPEIFTYHGKVSDKEKLKNIFQSCDIFAMPSSRETFGLVYIEAMLQGLPILYTENEGIDGYYTNDIGEKVKKEATVQEITEKLNCMIENYEDYKIPLEKIKKNHDWALIAKQYQKLYSNL